MFAAKNTNIVLLEKLLLKMHTVCSIPTCGKNKPKKYYFGLFSFLIQKEKNNALCGRGPYV